MAVAAAMSVVEDFSGTAPAAGDAAIDLGHLSRMTLGERSLEREVLALFDRQVEILMPRIRHGHPAVVAAAAHTLKGSAQGIGAWRVARTAEAVELAQDGDADALAMAVDALGAAVADTKSAIASLLRSH
jgi:HPt (histidine-containing phosphotransfer) domain-containing protein